MSIQKKINLFLCSLLVAIGYVRAELLIIKQDKQGCSLPLDSSDKPYEKAIADIMLAYSWPTVVGNTSLTQEESADLFSDKPYAEELFIEKKLKKINTSYRVLFIPTTLYELFTISHYGSFFNNPLNTAATKFKFGDGIDLKDNLNEIDKTVYKIKEKNYALYKASSDIFYPEAFFFINNSFISTIFNFYTPAKKIKEIATLSAELKAILPKFALFLVNNTGSNYIISQESLLPSAQALNNNSPITRACALEYEARELNKTVLFRGTYTIAMQIKREIDNINLLGSTIKEHILFDDILNNYKANTNIPYSISFGNSLFAGFFHDQGACAYGYLNVRGGYGLLVDKKDQIEHESSNLIFIAPLATLAGLFERGEFFHSRSKATVKRSNSIDLAISGICCDPIKDPCGILTTVRDPLTHASLFSNFLSKNIRLIEIPKTATKDVSELTIDAQRNSQETLIKKAQKKASHYFKLLPFFKKYIQKHITRRSIQTNSSLLHDLHN